jgi:organic radical activating enzyme
MTIKHLVISGGGPSMIQSLGAIQKLCEEKYFNFDNDNIKESFVKYLINIQHHIESDKPWALKELIAFDYDNLIDTNRIDRLNTYTSVCISQNLNIETTVFLLNSAFPEDKFCNILSMILSRGKENLLASIFRGLYSKGYVGNKKSLSETIYAY